MLDNSRLEDIEEKIERFTNFIEDYEKRIIFLENREANKVKQENNLQILESFKKDYDTHEYALQNKKNELHVIITLRSKN